MRWLALTLAFAALAPACSTKSPGSGVTRAGSGGDGNSAGTTGINTGSGGSGAGINLGDGGPPAVAGGLITADGGANITVAGAPKDVKLTATADGMPVTGTWTTSDTTIGSVGTDGTFHANGYVGGTVDVALLVGNGQIKITLTVDVDITENPANLADGDQTALKAGGAADPNFKFLYPFDGTVFPRGLPAPLLQFGDGKNVTTNATANGTYIKVTTNHFSYQQFGLGGTPIRGVIPEPVWKGATLSAGATDKVTVAVNKRTGSTVTGPVTENWSIAQGTLKGFIYYSTYKSPLLPLDSSGIGGGILRIKPGSTAPDVVRKGCVVCHSISATGNVLSAASGPDLMNPTSSDAVNISPDSPTPTPRGAASNGEQYAFAGLTPDGSLALTNGNVSGVPPVVPHGLLGDYQSILVNTSTGAQVPSPSLTSLVKHAQGPAFSPDGKHVAFLNGDVTPARELATMDFDGTSVFSNLKILRNETETTTNSQAAQGGSQPPQGPPVPKTDAWPSFTPDSAAVVYHSGDSFDSSGFNYNGTGTSYAQYAELRLVEADGSMTVKKLNALNGRDASGASVLPYGEAIDNNENYEPNMMPLPVGGYYWVVFTSRRSYGNTWAPGRAKKGDDQYDDPTQDPWGSNAGPSPRKKLWVAAIDVNHADAANLDPSHAAFYLPGQEEASANMRAFAALAPCQMDNATCESGSDCCGGYCRQTGNDPSGAPVLQCVPPPMNTCSNIDEPCMTSLDCCDPTNLCIAGRCALQPPVK